MTPAVHDRQPDRRARRTASGALRPASEHGVPSITTPIREWSTEQMAEDMRGERVIRARRPE